MIIDYISIIKIVALFIGYLFFCRFSFTLISFLNGLKDDLFKQSERLRSLYSEQYDNYVTTPSSGYRERNSVLEPERYYYKVSVFASGAFILFNSFILAQFLNQIEGVNIVLFHDPIKITYGTLLAAVIVFAEIITGFGYHIAYVKQQETKETIWATLKFAIIISFVLLMILEVVMWMNLSVRFEMSDKLNLDSNNFFRNFVDYFLAALGFGITLIEFFLGFLTSKYRKHSGDSSLLFSGRFLILTIGLIFLLFLPSVFLLIIGASIAILVVLIKFFCLIGNYVFDNIKKNKTPIIN